jgi:hypothetical protein
MAEHCAEDNLDCNGQLFVQSIISIVSSSTFWTSGTTNFQTRACLQKTMCENNSRLLLLGQCDEAFQVPPASSVQMLMHDFHDKSRELK